MALMSGRQFLPIGDVSGIAVTAAYESFGTLNRARDNAILVQHALTGDSHVAGPPGPDRRDAGCVGFSSDPAYPVRLQHEIADAIPSSGPAVVVDSEYGHDGFLVETDAMTTVLTRALADTACEGHVTDSDTVTDASTAVSRRPLHRNRFQNRERTPCP